MTWPWKNLLDLIEAEKWIEVEQRIQTTKGKKEVKEQNNQNWLPVHSACYNKAPYSTIKALLEEYPQAVSQIESRHNLPLHLAILAGCSFDVIDLLLKSFPTGVSCLNTKGWLPLHIACFVVSPIQVIEALHNAYPVGVEMQNKAGNLPLHLAIQSRASKEIIDFLIKANPDAAKVRNKKNNKANAKGKGEASLSQVDVDGSSMRSMDSVRTNSNGIKPPSLIQFTNEVNNENQLTLPLIEEETNTSTLIQLIENNDWRAASIRLQTEVGRQEVFKSDQDGWLPLHSALHHQAPFVLIEELLSINTESAKIKTNDGKLTLHFACFKSSLDLIKLVYEAYTDAIRLGDDDGFLPLHFIACDFMDMRRLEFILKAYPNGAQVQNKNGQLPIHLCCNRSIDFSPIELLCSDYPHGIFQSDNQGLLPLHYACNEHASYNVIEKIIQLYPDAVRCEDDVGALPLHIACQNSASLEVINTLLEKYPDAAQHADKDGWTPIFFTFHSSPRVIDALLRYNKTTVDKDGCLPLHIACFHKASVENIETLIFDYPQALKIPDRQGRLPIHYLCMNTPTFESLKLVVSYGSSVVTISDDKNRLPIHYACMNASSSTTDSITYLLSLNPSSVKAIDDFGNLPLHYICEFDEDKIIKNMIDTYPESLYVKNNNGQIPLHRVSCSTNSLFLMTYLLKCAPTTAFIVDGDGRLPIDIAVENSNSDSVNGILKVYEEEGIVVTKDEAGRYHPQLVYDNCSVSLSTRELI